jgi:hypothetical protein
LWTKKSGFFHNAGSGFEIIKEKFLKRLTSTRLTDRTQGGLGDRYGMETGDPYMVEQNRPAWTIKVEPAYL